MGLMLPSIQREARANGQSSTAAGVAPGQDWSAGRRDWTAAQADNFTDSFPLSVKVPHTIRNEWI